MIRVNICTNDSSKISPNVHLMPCSIEHDGDADVDTFFRTSIRQEKNTKRSGDGPKDNIETRESEKEHLTAAFRGRPLGGKKVTIPEGFRGYVMSEPKKSFAEEDERHMIVDRRFEEMTFWNLDAAPSANDKFSQAFTWLELAKAIHDPVTDEDSQRSLHGN